MPENWKNSGTAFLGIPRDVLPGEPVVTITGRESVNLENCRGIVSFQEEEIRLQAKTCRIRVTGRRLRIDYYTRDDMRISGQIRAVSMES